MTDFKNCTKTIKDCHNCPKLLICEEYEEYQPFKIETIEGDMNE